MELEQSIVDAFRGSTCYNRRSSSSGDFHTKRAYMEIPINEDTIELPLLAFKSFANIVNQNNDTKIETLVAALYSENGRPYYKTFSRYMKDLIRTNYVDNRLIRAEIKQKDTTINYYVSHGAVFNEKLEYLLLCTWEIHRVRHANNPCTYRYITPIIYVNPECFINPDDQMKKWVINHLISSGFSADIKAPGRGFDRSERWETALVSKLKVEIGDIPFKISSVDVPSISTTNEELLQVAINHINDISI